MRPMVKRGLLREIKPAIAQGKNPFPKDTSPFLHVAMNELLRQPWIRKAWLRALFRERFGWTEGTAYAHVSVATQIFLALGIASDDLHSLALRRPTPAKVS
jgi:hypothetical protein